MTQATSRHFLIGPALGSGYPPLLPSDVSGLVEWIEADTLSLADNAPVATWPDLSGAGADFLQASAPAQPIYKATALDSQPTVLFDGTASTMVCNLPANVPQPFTVFLVGFAVALPSPGTHVGSFYDGSLTTNRVSMGVNTGADPRNWFIEAAAVGTEGGSSVGGTADLLPHIFENFYDKQVGDAEIIVDGVQVAAGARPTGSGDASGIGLAFSPDLTTGGFFNCHIAAFALWNRQLTVAEHRGLRRHYSIKYDQRVDYP